MSAVRLPSAEQIVTALILVSMLGSGVWSVGSEALPAVLRATQERGFSPEVLALSLGLLLAGLWVQILYFAGPIAASAAQLQWLAVEEVLGHERMLTWLVAAVAIALLVTLAALVARAMGWPIPAVAVSIALGFTALLVVLLVTGPLILWRRDRARRDEGLTLVATPAGPLPLQTVNRTIAGYDVLAIAGLAALGL